MIGAADADRVRAGFWPRADPGLAAETAIRHGIWLVAGSIPLASGVPDKMRNSSLVTTRPGSASAATTKSISSVSGRTMRPTTRRPSSNRRPTRRGGDALGRVALSICYDLRFPSCIGPWGRSI